MALKDNYSINLLDILENIELNDKEKIENAKNLIMLTEREKTKKRNNQKKGLELHTLNERAKDEFKTLIRTALGEYCQLSYNILKINIESQYKTRFLYLTSYTEDDNKVYYGAVKKYSNRKGVVTMEELKKEKNRLATVKDLQEIWGLEERETRKTVKALKDSGLIRIEEDKTITLNKNVVRKYNNDNFNIKDTTRVFNEGLREIYSKATPKEHKRLFLLFELLPYVNINHNVLCTVETTNKKEIEEIRALKFSNLADTLGYKNKARFKKDLLNIKVGGRPVISLVENCNGKFLYINPKVYYRGSNIEDLRGLCNIFEIKH